MLKHVATTVQKFKRVAGVSEEQEQELFNTLVPHNMITDVTFDNGRLLHYLDQHYNSETGEFGDTLPPCFAVYIVESKKKIQQTREKKRAAYALRNAARGNDTLNEGWSVHEDSGDDGEDGDTESGASNKASGVDETENHSTVNQPVPKADKTTPMQEDGATGANDGNATLQFEQVQQGDPDGSSLKRKPEFDSSQKNKKNARKATHDVNKSLQHRRDRNYDDKDGNNNNIV